MKALYLWIVLLFLVTVAQAFAGQCPVRYDGFFNRDILTVPENSHGIYVVALGRAILDDVKGASSVSPESDIARRGFSGLGECVRAPLDSPAVMGELAWAE
ncbi:MAG: hypothetical protein HUU37_11345, partial [Bdellovibrionales bacterium]|nr:hypothetical protein [Bdellovibrionales bacterium]